MNKDLIQSLNIPSDVVVLEVKGHGQSEQMTELDLTSDRVPDSAFSSISHGIKFVKTQIDKTNNNATSRNGFYAFGEIYKGRVNYIVCKRK